MKEHKILKRRYQVKLDYFEIGLWFIEVILILILVVYHTN